MEEYLNNPYVRIALSIVATSALLSILNLFPSIKNGEKWYHNNKVLVLIMAVVFTLLLTNWEQVKDWSDAPITAFKVLFVSMFCFLVAISKGQEMIDKLVTSIADKIPSKATEKSEDVK